MKLKDFGNKLSDAISAFLGSWTFLIAQSILLIVWVSLNIVGIFSFDPYPFILLNLFMSLEAAYATPLLLMSNNRSAEKDRATLVHDLEVDRQSCVLLDDIKIKLELISKEIKELKQK